MITKRIVSGWREKDGYSAALILTERRIRQIADYSIIPEVNTKSRLVRVSSEVVRKVLN